jgi:D-lactate dehydrogenase
MNLTRSNRGYFDVPMLRQFKPGAVFVNISRGELSPPPALLETLTAGHLAGVALDVFDHEPQLAISLRSQTPSSDPEVLATIALAAREDCLCTPHNAFNSVEAVARKCEHSAQQIIAFQANGAFLWSPPSSLGESYFTPVIKPPA